MVTGHTLLRSPCGGVPSPAGGVAEWLRQGPAKPRTWVRFPPPPPGGVGEIRARPEAILATPSCVSSAEKRPDQGLGESSAMGG